MVVKLVNTNLIAPWFVATFKLRYRPIYIIRHPLAIIASREKYHIKNDVVIDERVEKFNWNRIKSKKHPYWEYKHILDETHTKFERYLAEWCIRNKEFVKGKYSEQVLCIYYEEMILNPKDSWKVIMEEYNLHEYRINYKRRSGTTALNEKSYTAQEQLNKWQRFFSNKKLERLQGIINKFDISTYSAFYPLPKHLQN